MKRCELINWAGPPAESTWKATNSRTGGRHFTVTCSGCNCLEVSLTRYYQELPILRLAIAWTKERGYFAHYILDGASFPDGALGLVILSF